MQSQRPKGAGVVSVDPVISILELSAYYISDLTMEMENRAGTGVSQSEKAMLSISKIKRSIQSRKLA